MNTNLKILDYDFQLNRTFGCFILEGEYDNTNKQYEKYDLIFCHREGMQDNFDDLIKYAHEDTKIICDISTESGNMQCFLDEFYFRVNSVKNKIYLIVDSDFTNHLEKVKYPKNVKILDSYYITYYAFLNPNGDNTMSTDNINISANLNEFMSLNNSCRYHRIFLFTEFIKRGLSFKNCSFNFSTGTDTGWKFNKQIYEQEINSLLDNGYITKDLYDKVISHKVPVCLDYDVSETPTYIYNYITEHYNPILNLITENLTGMVEGDITNENLITFTEKVIKPFQAKQIPLFIALPGLQNVLRDFGFDLFDDLINTDYELEMDHHKRIQKTVDELERLLKLDLVKFKNDNIDRFNHNYNLLFKLCDIGKKQVHSFLYNEILN